MKRPEQTPRDPVFKVPTHLDGQSLQEAIAAHGQLSRRAAKALVDTRGVLVNGRRIWMCRHRVAWGDVVELPPIRAMKREGESALNILLRDEHVLVVDKPHAWLSNGENSVESRMRVQTGNVGLRAAHRLDRDTTGCLLFAMNDKVFERIPVLFRAGRVCKRYQAIVEGRLPHDTTTLASPIDKRHALSHIRVIASSRFASHIEVEIETGRTHQIRKHLLSCGHSVLGDTHYGRNVFDEPTPALPKRQMLHAASLEFEHPITAQWTKVFAPLPPDFRACLRRFHLTARNR